jgi:KDO2-lipid IV(A) lauroyltransferase
MKETLIRAVLGALRRIPLPVLAAFFEAVMLVAWMADRKHRRIGRINLSIAFPEMTDREASRIVRLCFVRMGTSAAEILNIPKMDARYLSDHVRIEGAEHIRNAVSERGIGPFGLTGHFGNWEIMGYAFGSIIAPASVIVRPLEDPVMDRIVTELREWSGNRVIRKADSAKAVMREIREKRLVGILVDQNVDTDKGVLVDFFTRKAYTTFGIARMALAMKASIHPIFIFRDRRRKFHHTIRIGPPVPMDPDAPRDEEVVRLTRSCNEELEKAIREDPTQWFWLHRRWKTRPPGEEKIYEQAL